MRMINTFILSRKLHEEFVSVTFIRNRINEILVTKTENKKHLRTIGLDGRADLTLVAKNQVKREEHITFTGLYNICLK